MKILLTVLVLMALVLPAYTQDQKKILAEKIGSSEKIVKGSPFSAEAVSESIQMFADGNRIVRRSVSRVYRDSEGRYRREDMPRQMGVPGAVIEMPESILILDPVAGYRYQLNPNKNFGRRTLLNSNLSNKLDRDLAVSKRIDAQRKGIELREKHAEQREKHAEQRAKLAEQRSERAEARTTDADAELTKLKKAIPQGQDHLKDLAQETRETEKLELTKQEETKKGAVTDENTESLGTREIEGVKAEGTRITTTIPAGAIGNDRAIEVINERWYSNDLQMIVLSKRTDPGFGEQTYRLTNINRTEPTLSLFSPPDEYKIEQAGNLPMKLAGPTSLAPATIVKPPPTPPKPRGPGKP